MKLTRSLLSLIMVMAILFSSFACATELPEIKVFNHAEHAHEQIEAIEIEAVEEAADETVEEAEAVSADEIVEEVEAAPVEEVAVEEVEEIDLFDPSVYEEEETILMPEVKLDTEATTEIICVDCGTDFAGENFVGDISQYDDDTHLVVCTHGVSAYVSHTYSVTFTDGTTHALNCTYCNHTIYRNHTYELKKYDIGDTWHVMLCDICDREDWDNYREHYYSCLATEAADKTVCIACGAKAEDFADSEYSSMFEIYEGHNYVNGSDETRHWRICSDCGDIVYRERHYASCTEAATGICSDCGRENVTFQEDCIYHDTWYGIYDENGDCLEEYQIYIPVYDADGNSTGCAAQCENCEKAVYEVERHSAVCTNKYICTRCAYESETELSGIEHDFYNGNSELGYTSSGHWYVCAVEGCGATSAVNRHYAACNGELKSEYQCEVCVYVGANVDIEHHGEEEDYDIIYEGDAYGHYEVCDGCKAKVYDYKEDHYTYCYVEDKTVCYVCGEASDYIGINHETDWDNVQYDENYHWRMCSNENCGEIAYKSEHYANCAEGSDGVCGTCGRSDVNMRIEHEYWQEDMQGDATGHWYVCHNCGEQSEKSEHYANCGNPNLCEECGYADADGNFYVGHNTSGYESDANYHWQKCKACNEELWKSKHYGYCNNPKLCMSCGYVSETDLPVDHDFDWDEPSEITETYHAYKCKYCDYLQTSRHYVNCDSDSTSCSDCGAVNVRLRKSHYYTETFTPTADGKGCYMACLRCDKAIDYWDHYVECSNPGVCRLCGTTGLDTEIYVPNHGEGVVTDKNEDYHTYTCADCDETYLSYHYAPCNGGDVCEVCGATTNVDKYHYSDGKYTIDADGHTESCMNCSYSWPKEPHWAFCYETDACYSCGAANPTEIYHLYNASGVCVSCEMVRGSIVMVSALTMGVKEKTNLNAEIPNGVTVTYTTSNSKVATVSKTGQITAKKVGTATITAKTADGVSATCEVVVMKAPTSVKPTKSKVTLGVGETYTMGAKLSSKSASNKITFSSSKKSVAAVDANGVITAEKAGTAKITVKTFNGKKGTATITVKPAPEVVTVTASRTEMSVGQTAKLTTKLTTLAGKSAAGAYTYTASPADCATIEDGVLTALKAGTVTVTATTYNLVSGSTTIEVKPAPDKAKVEPAAITLGIKETYTLKPTTENGSPADFTFATDNKSVATVSSSGKITAKKAGTANITVTPHLGESVTVTVTVVKAPKSVKLSAKSKTLGVGEDYKLNATITSGSASALKWKSSKSSVVAVDQEGNLTPKKAGKATITVTTFNGKKATCTVTVKPAPESITLKAAKEEMSVGQKVKLTATLNKGAAGAYTYTAEPAGVVEFNGNYAVAVGEGDVTITATTYNEKSATASVKVLPAPDKALVDIEGLAITLGVKETYTLKPYIANGSPADYTFSTDKKSVATVSSSGKITAKKKGTANITVTPHLGEPVTVTVTVRTAPKSVKLSAKSKTLGVGEAFKLNATLSSGSSSALRWKSSKTSVVTVDQNGNLTPIKTGKATITVTTFNGKKASCAVTVKPAPESVTLTAAKDTLSVGQKVKLTTALNKGAAGSCTYAIVPEGKVVIEKGYVKAVEASDTPVTITATTFNGKEAAIAFNVLPAPDKVVVDTTAVTLGVKETLTLKPTIANGSPADIKFKSSKSSVASVSSSGKITAKKAGKATITITPHAGEPVSVVVTVKAAAKSVKLSAKTLNLNVGDTSTLTAKVSGGSNKLTWKSSNTAAVTVDANGNLNAVGEGKATITVTTFNKKKATCTVYVTAPAAETTPEVTE